MFADLFTGSAAAGGFLGSSVAFAFNKGVGRGLFSNEAGQGSAPIAHAAAKAHEPVSEGLVAILEPFIDTIVICTITGLVLLSSGVWNEKHQNEFQYADMQILQGSYSDADDSGKNRLYHHIAGIEELPVFSGDLNVENGKITDDISILHARSLAENVTVYKGNDQYTGTVAVEGGNAVVGETQASFWDQLLGTNNDQLVFRGSSLVHSAPLTNIAFTRSFFGESGKYIVTIGLLLFAFSTAISWSYYGDRAMTYLFGSRSVTYYRVVYVVAFFFAAFTDTTIIWTLSGITIALMTIPNLFGLLMLHKDVRGTIRQYWSDFKNEWPEEKTPE